MKRIFAFLLLSVSVGVGGVRAQNKTTPLDVVLDIDGTTYYTTTNGAARYEPQSLLSYGDHRYRPSDHLLEFLAALHREENLRVSFFSGGPQDRNEFLVRETYARLNDRFKSSYEPFRVKNFDDLERVTDVPDTAPFTQRYRKDLRKVDPSIDLKRAILVDDVPEFVHLAQRRNLLWTGHSYGDLPEFSTSLLRELRQPWMVPDSRAMRGLERNKLPRALAVIRTARANAKKSGRSVVEEIFALTHDRAGRRLHPTANSQVILTGKGLKMLGLPASSLERVKTPKLSENCGIEALLD